MAAEWRGGVTSYPGLAPATAAQTLGTAVGKKSKNPSAAPAPGPAPGVVNQGMEQKQKKICSKEETETDFKQKISKICFCLKIKNRKYKNLLFLF